MRVKIYTLTENTACISRGRAEWGLSILVQIDDRYLLCDTGASSILLHNAEQMGLDLHKIDTIIISHGHYDHMGGLAPLLDKIGGRPIIAHPDIWAEKYVINAAGQEEYAGAPDTRAALEAKGAVFHLSREPQVLMPGVTTTGEVPMATSFESIEGNLMVKQDGQLRPDPLADDLSLVIETPRGLLLISGCAHRGLINHLWHAQNLTGENRIYAMVGGTHLMAATAERIEATVAELKKLDPDKIGASHCTGFQAAARLAQEFGEKFFLNNAGTVYQLL